MRHGRTHNHLGRTHSHRTAMLANLACSLIEHKRIETTLPKARELRKYVEPILTKAKTDSTHSRRIVFSYLQNKEMVTELFGTVAEKIANRPGGYTRIIKLGNRMGDNAELALIELVDFNELMLTEAKPAKARTRRSRRGGAAVTTSTAPATAPISEIAPAEDVAAVTGTEGSIGVAENTAAAEDNANIVPTAQGENIAEATAQADNAPEASAPEGAGETPEDEQPTA